MRKLSISEIQTLLTNEFTEAWFIGQRKWSGKLAQEVIQLRDTLQNSENSINPDPAAIGLVLLRSLAEVNHSLLADCDRFYVFNQDKQLKAIQCNSDTFMTQIYIKADNEKQVSLCKIDRPQKNTYHHRYSFASLIGSIPDFKEFNISVWINHTQKTWRFSHE